MAALATDPPVSEKQRRAMWAAASGHSTLGIPQNVGKEFANADPGGKLPASAKDAFEYDLGKLFEKYMGKEARENAHQNVESSEFAFDAPKRAAGIAFTTSDGRSLFVKRSGDGDHGGEWAFPGGMTEGDELPDATARREALEELGDCTMDRLVPLHRATSDEGVDFTTYAQPVEETFVPKLNGEHTEFVWAYADDPPKPLHPGVEALLHRVFGTGGPIADDEELSHGKLSETTREKIGEPGSEKREDMPEDVFLGPNRTYPVKEKRDGKWEYTEKLLEAAAKRARLQGKTAIAARANALRREKFGGGSGAKDAMQLHEKEGALQYREDQAGLNDDGSPKPGFSMSSVVKRNQPGYGNGGSGHPKFKTWTTNSEGAADEGRFLALDRESKRSFDSNGYLHVSSSNISKATVNPYFGREINAAMKGKPGWVPLEDSKKYMLLRDPTELQKAVPTFNNLPILRKHVPISASKFSPEDVIGGTGTDAAFMAPYVTNSLAFHRKPYIDEIEDGDKKQLSAAYSYVADMTPGEYEGTPYDGVMRDIKGNHVALVKEGRAGPDVVVGDSNPFSEEDRQWRKLATVLRAF